ncbi:MAG: GNAT family N-acetyltransferase [Dehalococcoidia bacterium]
MNPFLETARLTLRQFEASDLDHLVALDSDPEVMRYLTGGAPTPRETLETTILPRFIASSRKYGGLGYFAALHRDTAEFLGWFALHPNDDTPQDISNSAIASAAKPGGRVSPPKALRLS